MIGRFLFTVSIGQFLRETRQEIRRVVWPSRREILLSSVMVVVLTSLFALFFFLVDLSISSLVGLVHQ